eukprot:6037265-Pleurochrysis_carterae.AAC.1
MFGLAHFTCHEPCYESCSSRSGAEAYAGTGKNFKTRAYTPNWCHLASVATVAGESYAPPPAASGVSSPQQDGFGLPIGGAGILPGEGGSRDQPPVAVEVAGSCTATASHKSSQPAGDVEAGSRTSCSSGWDGLGTSQNPLAS